MYNIRLVFKKTGQSAYISHLDMMKVLQRAICRANLPAMYSQGFNPHIILSIPAPLSTGHMGLEEICDMEFHPDFDPALLAPALNGVLPVGMEAVSAARPVKKVNAMKFCRWRIELPGLDALPEGWLDTTVMRRRKSGEVPVTLRGFITEYRMEPGVLECVIKHGDDSLNPSYAAEAIALCGGKFGEPTYLRLGILDEEMNPFR